MPKSIEGSGTFALSINWTPDAISNFQKIDRTYSNISNFEPLWNDIATLISKGIAEQLIFGTTPEGDQWEPLSPIYAMRTGRTRMYIPQFSPIWDAYVMHPRLFMSAHQLVYEPSGIPEIYHLALRFGWVARGGRYVPGREWFGISDNTHRLINEMMNTYINEQMKSGLK
jgi:hypothetical protein